MPTLLRVLSLAAAIGFCLGCGSLVDGQYKGEPLAIILGELTGDLSITPDNAFVGIAWDEGDSTSLPQDLVQLVEVEAQFPSSYALFLYQQPPAHLVFAYATGDALKAAHGNLWAMEDQNGDGLTIVNNVPLGDDRIIGRGLQSAIVFVENRTGSPFVVPFSTGDSILLLSGYHIVHGQCDGTALQISALSTLSSDITLFEDESQLGVEVVAPLENCTSDPSEFSDIVADAFSELRDALP